MIYDSAIIGTGPAGLSAALNLKIRDKSFVWIGSGELSNKISMAEKIANYPGHTNISGAALSEAFIKQIADMEINIIDRMVNSVMPVSDRYAIMAGSDFYEARTVILATGIANAATLQNESDFVGRGVSYCATCDGNLYKGKTIAVICNDPRFEHEVTYLADIAKKVYFFPSYKNTAVAAVNTELSSDVPVGIIGDKRVSALRLKDGAEIAVDGIFCLRNSVALNTLLPMLKTENGHIIVDRMMKTNLHGVFAAGDCTGRPYQYAKAVGEGNIAAHSVLEYLSEMTSGSSYLKK